MYQLASKNKKIDNNSTAHGFEPVAVGVLKWWWFFPKLRAASQYHSALLLPARRLPARALRAGLALFSAWRSSPPWGPSHSSWAARLEPSLGLPTPAHSAHSVTPNPRSSQSSKFQPKVNNWEWFERVFSFSQQKKITNTPKKHVFFQD